MEGIYFLLLLLSANLVFGDEICSTGKMDMDSWYYESETIITVSGRGLIEEYDTVNVTNVTFSDGKYLKPVLEKNKLRIELTDDFKNYEENENRHMIKDEINIHCSDGKENDTFTFEYRQEIKYENNHDPLFTPQNKYSYIIYGQIRKSFQISDLLKIQVNDKDVRTDDIVFSIEDNDDLEIEDDGFDNKIATAALYTLRTINPPYKETFKITARDSVYGDENPRSSDAYVTLDVRPIESTFDFKEKEYTATIKGKSFTLNKPIELVGGVDDEVKATIRSDYSEYFRVTIDHVNKGIKIELKEELPKPRTLHYLDIILDLDVSWKGHNATAKITAKSEEEIALLCKINGITLEDTYTYTNPDPINDTATGVIQVFNKTLNVQGVSCNDSDYMTCSYENNEVVVSLTENFKNYEETESKYLMTVMMDVQCPYEVVKIRYNQKITNTNNHPPEFNKERYYYTFYSQIPKNFRFNTMIPVRVSDADLSNENKVTIQSNDFLKLDIYNVKQKSMDCRITALKNIDPGAKFVVSLEVEESPMRDMAYIHVEVLEDSDQLKFTKNKYGAKYENKRVVFEDEVALDNGFDDETEFFITSEHDEYFKIHGDLIENKIVFEHMDEIVALADTEITIEIEARWKGLKANTLLVVDVTGQGTPSPTDEPEVTTQREENYFHVRNFTGWFYLMGTVQTIIFALASLSMVGMIFMAWRYYYYKV